MISLLSLGRCSVFVAGLSSFLLPQIAFAQPPAVSSTIKKPPAFAGMGMPAPPPDPPQISPTELLKLTGGPTLVTLSGTNLPSVDVSKALSEAARLPNGSRFGMGVETLSVDWKQTPFWIAAEEIEKLTKLTFRSQFGDTLGLSRVNDGKGIYGIGLNGKLAARTPFITLVATSISRTETIQNPLRQQAAQTPDVPEKSNQIQLLLSVYLDPRLKSQSVALRDVTFLKAGETVPVANPNDRFGYSYGGERGPILQQSLRVAGAVGAGTTLSRILGVLHTVLIVGTETFGVPDIIAAPQATREIQGTSYSLQSATVVGNTISIRVATQAGDVPNQNRNFGNVFSMLSVRDAQGQELRRGGSSTTGSGSKSTGEFSFNLRNMKGEAVVGPYSLDWKIVSETRSLDVPFELRDVVVP